MQCYGYGYAPGEDPVQVPGSYSSQAVFSYGGHCAEYGCVNNETFYLNYRHIDYCVVSGTSEDGKFVSNIGNHPLPAGSCQDNGFGRICNIHYAITGFNGERTYPSATQLPASSGVEFVKALLLTVALEAVVVWLLITILHWGQASSRKNIIKAGTIPSLITLPYAWLMLFYTANVVPLNIRIIIIELIVVVVEALLLKYLLKYKLWQVLIISLLANTASYAVEVVTTASLLQ